MQSSIKIRLKQLAKVASCSFLISLITVISSCKDTPACDSCLNGMVFNPIEERCECPQEEYRMYDFFNDRWVCKYVSGDIETDSTISNSYVFNGNQFGAPTNVSRYPIYNQMYNLVLDYNKELKSYLNYRVNNPLGGGIWPVPSGTVILKKDDILGDSIYINNMFLKTTPFTLDYIGLDVLTTGRGLISPDRDTIDMTVYFLDLRTINPDADPDKPIDISDALDIRKMTLLSSRVLPKY